jgi:uncharacterized protein YdbL (DUF1318 family)
MKFRFISVVMVTLAVAAPAWALDLHEARAKGVVGEKADGYVGAISPSAEVTALVNEVNDKRRAEYTRISKQNGQSVEVVAKLAAPQIQQGLEAGSKYQDASGAWKTR